MQKNIPLYAIICFGGGLNTIEYREEKTKTATHTGGAEYYGPYDPTKYPGIPVVDLTDATSEQIIKHINIPDGVRPKEENSVWYKGTLETYLQACRDIGLKVEVR